MQLCFNAAKEKTFDYSLCGLIDASSLDAAVFFKRIADKLRFWVKYGLTMGIIHLTDKTLRASTIHSKLLMNFLWAKLCSELRLPHICFFLFFPHRRRRLPPAAAAGRRSVHVKDVFLLVLDSQRPLCWSWRRRWRKRRKNLPAQRFPGV